ncbi:hypothetical protein C8A03DRAFT_36955 [Achaetomium macrosporum]|uniref:Uncharacterized protein n=1 Tax=Achaetomium macrosporum TaxID=79813 RepID=A0AAN7C4E6_9PEZI|nr:hypothetical protein C8A03DRAFT_36955 [Achaetomium macrosporum]
MEIFRTEDADDGTLDYIRGTEDNRSRDEVRTRLYEVGSRPGWFSREAMQLLDATFQYWERNPHNQSQPLWLVDHLRRRIGFVNKRGDLAYDHNGHADPEHMPGGFYFGLVGVVRRPYLKYRTFEYLKSQLDRNLEAEEEVRRVYDLALLPMTVCWSVRDARRPEEMFVLSNNEFRTQLLHNVLQYEPVMQLTEQLEGILQNLPLAAGKIVAFASNGNLASSTGHEQEHSPMQVWHRQFESYQMVVIRAIRTVLARRQPDRNIPCFVQDRSYRASESFSHPLQPIQYVEDPRGFLEINDHTTVVVVTA